MTSNRFETVEEARGSGLFERGWLPDVLPPEAGPIEERHDLDTNAHCSRSSFPPVMTSEVVENLLAQGFVPGPINHRDLPWRTCPFNRHDIANADMRLSRKTPHGVEQVALNKGTGILLVWSAGA